MDTPGKRVYAIRLALGDGWKTPMTMAAFATLLTRKSGSAYDSAKVSRMESGERSITIPEADLLASVDPLKRGRAWVAWGESSAEALPPGDFHGGRQLTDEEIARARAIRDAERASKTAPAKTPARKANGGGRKRG